MKAKGFRAYLLAGLIALLVPPGQVAPAGATATALFAAPAAHVETVAPAPEAMPVEAANLSDEVREQTREKEPLREPLSQVPRLGAARGRGRQPGAGLGAGAPGQRPPEPGAGDVDRICLRAAVRAARRARLP
jgi:hypothetical protein